MSTVPNGIDGSPQKPSTSTRSCGVRARGVRKPLGFVADLDDYVKEDHSRSHKREDVRKRRAEERAFKERGLRVGRGANRKDKNTVELARSRRNRVNADAGIDLYQSRGKAEMLKVLGRPINFFARWQRTGELPSVQQLGSIRDAYGAGDVELLVTFGFPQSSALKAARRMLGIHDDTIQQARAIADFAVFTGFDGDEELYEEWDPNHDVDDRDDYDLDYWERPEWEGLDQPPETILETETDTLYRSFYEDEVIRSGLETNPGPPMVCEHEDRFILRGDNLVQWVNRYRSRKRFPRCVVCKTELEDRGKYLYHPVLMDDEASWDDHDEPAASVHEPAEPPPPPNLPNAPKADAGASTSAVHLQSSVPIEDMKLKISRRRLNLASIAHDLANRIVTIGVPPPPVLPRAPTGIQPSVSFTVDIVRNGLANLSRNPIGAPHPPPFPERRCKFVVPKLKKTKKPLPPLPCLPVKKELVQDNDTPSSNRALDGIRLTDSEAIYAICTNARFLRLLRGPWILMYMLSLYGKVVRTMDIVHYQSSVRPVVCRGVAETRQSVVVETLRYQLDSMRTNWWLNSILILEGIIAAMVLIHVGFFTLFMNILVCVALSFLAKKAKFELPYQGVLWPVAAFVAWPMSWIQLRYCPHMVTCVAADFDMGSYEKTIVGNISSKMRRLGTMPIPDYDYLQIVFGSVQAVVAILWNRNFMERDLA